MATKRRAWFRVYDKVLREDWDDRTLATVVRLLAWMHQRWWRDGLTLKEASTAMIGSLDAMKLTGIGRRKEALRYLARLPLEAGLRSASASLVTLKSGSSVALDWPKFAELQELTARNAPAERPQSALSETETEIRLREERLSVASLPQAVAPRRENGEPSEPEPEVARDEAASAEWDRKRALYLRAKQARTEV